jgi:protein-tyrosine-phosphatase
MKVLFICKNNQFRSQMAAALYNKLTASNDACSAGTYVGSVAVPEGAPITQYFRTSDFFDLMNEHGMDLRDKHTCKLTPEMLEAAHLVIAMAQEPFIPDYLKNNQNVIWWNVADPKSVTRDVAEDVYAQIFNLVADLVDTRWA